MPFRVSKQPRYYGHTLSNLPALFATDYGVAQNIDNSALTWVYGPVVQGAGSYVMQCANMDTGNTRLNFLNNADGLTKGPADYRYLLFSCWFEFADFPVNFPAFSTFTAGAGNVALFYDPTGNTLNVNVLDRSNAVVFDGSGSYTPTAGMHNWVLSFDTTLGIIDSYIDDIITPISAGAGRVSTNPAPNSFATPPGIGDTQFAPVDLNIGDYWMLLANDTYRSAATFRADFVDGGGRPKYLGQRGELITGLPPTVFLSLQGGFPPPPPPATFAMGRRPDIKVADGVR